VKLKTTKVIGLSLVFFGHGRRKVERGMFGWGGGSDEAELWDEFDDGEYSANWKTFLLIEMNF
jgi:hypothetical protein